MIRTEMITINGKQKRRTYSDEGFRINKVGTDDFYDNAIDLPETDFVYVETTDLISEGE